VRPLRAGRCLLAVLVTFGVLVLTPSPSWACSCVMATTPQHVHDAVTVASGTVDWTASDGQTRTYRVDFDSVYKGAAAESEKISTNANDASCGLGNLATGRRYLFFIDGRHPGAMRVSLCGGTIAYDAAVARQVEAVTGPPGKPLTTPASASVADDPSTRTVVIALGAAGLLVAAAVVGLVLRRRNQAVA
jgi:hypothetical protein